MHGRTHGLYCTMYGTFLGKLSKILKANISTNNNCDSCKNIYAALNEISLSCLNSVENPPPITQKKLLKKLGPILTACQKLHSKCVMD